MSDLISRKALIDSLETYKKDAKTMHELLFLDAVMAIVDNQLTAFDVEEVVQNLIKLQKVECPSFNQSCTYDKNCEDCKVEACIKIVKGVVKNE